MAVTKGVLSQYISEKKEVEELQQKIALYGIKIKSLEKKISEIESLHTKECEEVIPDINNQGFLIEDSYFDEWDDAKTELELKKRMLCQMESLLLTAETQLILREKQTEQFICSVNDSMTRRILRFRVVDGLKWKEVAQKIGGNNTEDGVRAIYSRFLGK